MFGLPDNNPFGLKVDTYLRLAKIPFKTEHLIDPGDAPRGQLPYIKDEGKIIGDSNRIINYLGKQYKTLLDAQLIEAQKKLQFLITRILDNHLYWVISYSRWQDEQYWPQFKAEFLRQVPEMTATKLEKMREANCQKYYYQGIGRYEPEEIYLAGIEDIKAIDSLLVDHNFLFGNVVHSIDACCYGFLANIIYFSIETPLKKFIIEETSLVKYTDSIRGLLLYEGNEF